QSGEKTQCGFSTLRQRPSFLPTDAISPTPDSVLRSLTDSPSTTPSSKPTPVHSDSPEPTRLIIDTPTAGAPHQGDHGVTARRMISRPHVGPRIVGRVPQHRRCRLGQRSDHRVPVVDRVAVPSAGGDGWVVVGVVRNQMGVGHIYSTTHLEAGFRMIGGKLT